VTRIAIHLDSNPTALPALADVPNRPAFINHLKNLIAFAIARERKSFREASPWDGGQGGASRRCQTHTASESL